MRILLSNDDGYTAPGIECLQKYLSQHHIVEVVAPDRDRSGASNSLTLDRPLRISKASNGFRFVDGTPADCVHLATSGLLSYEPEIVVAGINAGANLGDDVLYSGTVAAAMEGRFLGLPSIAVSLAGTEMTNYHTAAVFVDGLLETLQGRTLPTKTILNVNVPDISVDSVAGVRVTRLGSRGRAELAIIGQDPKGRSIYWVGPPGPVVDGTVGTDFDAIRNNYVSVTPVEVDLTNYDCIKKLETSLYELKW